MTGIFESDTIPIHKDIEVAQAIFTNDQQEYDLNKVAPEVARQRRVGIKQNTMLKDIHATCRMIKENQEAGQPVNTATEPAQDNRFLTIEKLVFMGVGIVLTVLALLPWILKAG